MRHPDLVDMANELPDGFNAGVRSGPVFDLPKRGEGHLGTSGQRLQLGVRQARELSTNHGSGRDVGVHSADYIEFGMNKQPHSECPMVYRIRMAEQDTKAVLWINTTALMKHHWGEANLNRLAREAHFGPATSTRLKEMQTSVGVDVLAKIAGVFKIDPWQLLVPDLDPKALPSVSGGADSSPLFDFLDVSRYLALSEKGRGFVQGYLSKAVEEIEAREKRAA